MSVVMKFFYALLVFSLPFNGVRPLLPAGELSGDGFFYASLLFNASMVLGITLNRMRLPARVLRPMWRYLSVPVVVFLLMTLLNFGTVLGNSTGLRYGVSKFVLGYGVLLYYAATFSLIAVLAGLTGREQFLRFTARLFCISGAFMGIVACVEVAGWFNGAARSLLVGFRSLFASFPERVLFRISGVSYEPSFYAIAMLTALPWTLLHARLNRSRLAWVIALLLVLACVLSAARTAWVGLAGYLLVTAIARMRWRIAPILGAMVPVVAMVLGPLVPLYAYSMVWSFDNVSNISRSFLASRAVMVGLEHPFGVGFGQVQFYFRHMMDASVNLSWELRGWFMGDRAGQLPPIFSWYGRTLGEIGLVVYILLVLGAAIATYNLFRVVRRYERHALQAILFRMAIGYFGIFLGIGLSSDSYKFSPFWFMFLLVGLFQSFAAEGRREGLGFRLRRPVPFLTQTAGEMS